MKYKTYFGEQWVEVTLNKMLSERFQNEYPDGITLDFNGVPEDMRISKFLPSNFRPTSFKVNSINLTHPRRNVLVIPKFAATQPQPSFPSSAAARPAPPAAASAVTRPTPEPRCRSCGHVYDIHKRYDHPWQPDNEPVPAHAYPPPVRQRRSAAPEGSGLCRLCGCDRAGCAKYDHPFTPI